MNKLLSLLTMHSRYLREGENWVDCIDDALSILEMRTDNKITFSKKERELMYSMKVFPSMRLLQFRDSVFKKNERIYNCCGLIGDRINVIAEAFYMLGCGCGCGINISKKHIRKLPKIIQPSSHSSIYTIQDDIYDFYRAVKMLLLSYTAPNFGQIEFDYSHIAPEGTILKSSGKPSAGYSGFKKALDLCRNKLNSKINQQLAPIDFFDLVCYLSDFIAAGGTRRSALIFAFDYDDKDMMECKRGNWYKENPQRSNANISFIAPKIGGFELLKLLTEEFNKSLQFGEPGILFIDDDYIVNPCAEVVFLPWYNGQSSYQFCNLSEVNLNNVLDTNEFAECVDLATKIGTIQSLFTNFNAADFHTAKKLNERDRLLGVSLTGVSGNLHKFQKINVREINKKYAEFLGINPSARLTVVKPSGTVSTVAGCSAGIHPYLFREYIRFVRFSVNEPEVEIYKELIGEKYIHYERDGKIAVLGFPVSVNGNSWEDKNAIENFINDIKFLNENWIDTNNSCGFNNSISCTALLNSGEGYNMALLTNFLVREYLRGKPVIGMTVLSKFSGYEYAPYTSKETMPTLFNELKSKFDQLPNIDFSNTNLNKIKRREFNSFCDSESCEIKGEITRED